MAKLVLDVELVEPISTNTIIKWNGEKWVNISKEAYLSDLYCEIDSLKKEIEQLNNSLTTFKSAVNEKLNDYHKVLNVLVKENE